MLDLTVSSPLLESGVLAYRLDRRGEPRVLVLTTSKSGRWGIPKGKIGSCRGFGENAAKEAYEEAGILGEVSPTSAGMYRTTKRLASGEIVIEVWVYLMKVTEVLADFPEKGRREIKWVSPAEAAKLLREPFLAGLCQSLAATKTSNAA